MDGLNNFTIKDVYKEQKSSFRALYVNNDISLKVETLSQPNQFTADQYIAADISRIKGLFTDSLAPYPGVASKTITCDKKYEPTYHKIVTADKLEVSYFIAYLNTNFTYGSCTESQVVYRGISAYFYCSKSKIAYHLEMIAPTKDFELKATEYINTIESIRCN